MSNTIYDINTLRNTILESQHLRKRSSDSIEDIVSDICGLQYDPYLNVSDRTDAQFEISRWCTIEKKKGKATKV